MPFTEKAKGIFYADLVDKVMKVFSGPSFEQLSEVHTSSVLIADHDGFFFGRA